MPKRYGLGIRRHAKAPAWREEVGGRVLQRQDRVAEFGAPRETRVAACPFCNHEQHLPPFVVKEHTMVIPGKAPPFPGHALITPLEHKESITDLNPHEMNELGELIQKIHRGMKKQGHNVYFGFNWRRIAGQSVTHLHVHVLPQSPAELPSLVELNGSRFFDPLAEQIIQKVKTRVEAEGGELKKVVKFRGKIAAPIRLDFKNVEEFTRAGPVLRQLYKITDEEYTALLKNPNSAGSIAKYGERAEAHRQSDIRLLSGELKTRTNRLQREAQKEGVELPAETLRDLVRSNEVGLLARITMLKGKRVRLELLPRATVVTPASVRDALKGRRDI
ncbi:MAG: HIT domain-containing protein, partial [Candidatus Micrarchaeota archaeon]|nr:HIT domain-containing protein [Candidatus Micrarchaeota archaeon]